MEHLNAYEFFARRKPASASVGDNIRLDCYMAILERARQANPRANFEIITRREANSALSPSITLAWLWNARKISVESFTKSFLAELKTRPEALQALRRLHDIAEQRLVFLVCHERDPERCHRSIVKQCILKYGKMGIER